MSHHPLAAWPSAHARGAQRAPQARGADEPRNAAARQQALTLATFIGALVAFAFLALCSSVNAAQPAVVASHALVALDRTPLRAAPREGAPVHAELTQGDLLEVRGQRLDHLQVYDHRRERAGFVRAEAVRRVALPHPGSAAGPASVQVPKTVGLMATSVVTTASMSGVKPATTTTAAAADELLAIVRFLRHTPGQEALGIAHVAAYLKLAAPEGIDAEPFDALGTMAERLARRASAARTVDAAAAHVDAVAPYGVRFTTIEREGRAQVCYDGEGFRRALALQPDVHQQARALLALTRHDCIDPLLTPSARIALDTWRADLLDEPWRRGYGELSALMKNRLHLRRAGVWAARAHQLARLQRSAQPAAERALAELASVDKSEFTDEDQLEYADAAIRVGAVRWAALPAALPTAALPRDLRLVVRAGTEPGQTCVTLLAAETAARGDDGPRRLAERCTFGTVWPHSAAARPAGDAMVLAVQPLEGWTELWLFRANASGAPTSAAEATGRVAQEGREGREVREARDSRAARDDAPTPWRVDVLPPAANAPGLGYIEFAGWVPGREPRLLLARESRTDGRFARRFEVVSLDTLDVVKQASTPNLLVAFGQWSDAQWRRRTVALR